ncbi:MAG TPA: hypothetical protein PLW93_00045 [Candidatus Absconditabacterales bacterium]|nr:hypothetical protein [Candidatus Absconditabacterales bacterium]HNG96643.1 hypothetical protein [Candidatus Absconditabacterales bacterium]
MFIVEHQGSDILVNNRFLFSPHKGDQGDSVITCALVCGQDVEYGSIHHNYINYPGEYQQDDFTIYCIMSNDSKLNFVIKSLQADFAFIQDAKAVNAAAFEGVTDVIAHGEGVQHQLQKLDLQCNIVTS